MRQFQFNFKIGDKVAQVSIAADIIDVKSEKFTLMDIQGDAADTEFQKMFPWWKGSVITYSELRTWFKKFRGFFDSVIEYGDASGAITWGDEADVKDLAITPTIVNGDKATMNVNVYNPDGVFLRTEVVKLTNGQSKTIAVLMGYIYNFSLPEGESWTSGSAPANIVVDGDETLAAGINVPNDSEVKVLTITPTITGTGPVVMKMTGTKQGYANDVIEVSLNTDPVAQNVFKGYKYAFSLVTEGATWTSGSAPADKTITNDDTLAVAITI